MSKVFTKIAALILIVTLSFIPTATAYAEPIVTMDDGELTFIDYQPHEFVAGGRVNSVLIKDITNTDGCWHVPAGKKLNLTVFTDEANSTVEVFIFKNGSLVSQYVTSSTIHGFGFKFTPEPTDNKWLIIIMPYYDVTLLGYGAAIVD